MKSLNEFISESAKDEFNPNDSHQAALYNDLMSWYDKCIERYMNKDEVISCLKYAIENWEKDNFENL